MILGAHRAPSTAAAASVPGAAPPAAVRAACPSPGAGTPARDAGRATGREPPVDRAGASCACPAGLNVLTGETGAGKTVLAHALDLLLGGRSRAGIVRPGAEEAYVEGVFEIPPELGEELGEELSELLGCGEQEREVVLARRVRADGRTRALDQRAHRGRGGPARDRRRAAALLRPARAPQPHAGGRPAGDPRQPLRGRAARAAACLRGRPWARARARAPAGAAARPRASSATASSTCSTSRSPRSTELAPDPEEHARMLAARERLRALDSLLAAAGAASRAPARR